MTTPTTCLTLDLDLDLDHNLSLDPLDGAR